MREMKVLGVVKLRSNINMNQRLLDSSKSLKLLRVHNCVLVPKTPEFEGVLKKLRSYVTWGEVSEETVKSLLVKRGELINGDKISEEEASKIVKGLFNGKLVKELGVKRPFKLRPPKKGLKSKKRFYPKGDLGYRGEAINDLIMRML